MREATIKSHNIGALLNLLPESVSIPSDIWQSVILTDYEVVTRYPGDYEPVSDKEYKEALHFAELVLHWSENQIRKKS